MGLLKQYNASMDSWEVVGGITATTITEAIAAATSKTTPVTADLFFISDSADGLGKKVTYGNLRTALFNSPTFVTPALGTPASGTLTNCTGLPIGGLTGLGTNVATALGNTLNAASGLVGYSGALGTPTSGTLTNCTGLPISGIASLATGMGTFLATPSSANLAATVTNETGSGSLVFATNPVLVTPNIGTPSAGTLTNCSGLPISGIAALGTGVASALGNAVNGASGLAVATASGSWLFGAASESASYKVRIGGGLRIDPNTAGNTGLYQVFDSSLAASTTVTSYTATGYITHNTSSSVRGISYWIYNEVPTGITASSSIGLQIISLRNNHNADTDDGGTLANKYGVSISYGHFNSNVSAAPVTTSSSGIKITPYAQTGTITTNIMLYLASQIGSATVSNKWAIYQEDANYRNYFNGTVLVGTAYTDGVNKLQVAGSTITQGLISGGNGLSSGTIGVNALLSGSCDYYWYTGGSLRWIMRRTTDAESGSDAGSNLDIMSRTDTGTSKSTIMRFMRGSGNVLIGATSDYAYSSKLYVYTDKYDISSAGIQTYVVSRCTASGSISSYGSCMVVDPRVASGIANSGSAYSILAQSYTLGTGFAGSLANLYGVSSQTGIYACDSGATIANVYGLHSVIYNGSANGTITNAYGCYIVNNQTVGTITNRWGFYQVGTLARNYYQGRSMFGGANTNDDATNIVQVYGSAKIQNGGISLLIGGDNGAITLTDATIKLGRIALHHYTNAEEPVGFLFGYMGATTNEISVGGGTSNVNAATLLKFYTAANNTTTMGTEAARITSNQNFMIGVTSETVAYRFQAVNNKTDADSYGIVGNAGVTLTANGTYASVGVMGNAVTQNVASGLANASSATGVLGYGHVSSTSFAGTLTGSYGVRGYAGIYYCIAGAPTTTVTNAYGLFGYIYNNDADGTITNAYGCYIDNSQTTGTITNRWGFYQVGASANNYFQASVNIGTTSPSASYMLQVSGTAKATRSLETAAALTPGATVTLDSSAGSYFTLIPAQTCQINATNPIAGQRLVLAITTSGTSSYTITFGTNFKSTGTLATGTVTAKVFVLAFACFDGTTFCEISRTTAM